jgi:hypoxanthine phosphoribosyltransferase
MNHISNDIESILVSEEEIASIARRIGAEICGDYKDSTRPLVVLVILKGSLMFASELLKNIDLPLEVEFMKVSSYGGGTHTTGIINVQIDLKREDLSDLDILVVEDIIDSGRTLSRLCELLSHRGAHSVKTVTMLDKPSRREVDFIPDYTGRQIPDAFVVGYGLDYNEKYRNLPYVGILKPEIYKG